MISHGWNLSVQLLLLRFMDGGRLAPPKSTLTVYYYISYYGSFLSLGSAGVPTRIRIRFSIFPHKETKKKMECNMRVQTAPKM